MENCPISYPLSVNTEKHSTVPMNYFAKENILLNENRHKLNRINIK